MANKQTDMVLISPYSKVKVQWSDLPENYSRSNKTKITNYFASKYGVNKSNINVSFKAVKFNANGDTIEINGAGIDNIMDVNYQRSLMKEVIARDGKTVDFNRLLVLDDKVNGDLNMDLTASQHRNWSIKWIMVDNFLSFGENNYIPFNKMNGLTIVNSVPSNQGGKTTLTIDSIMFLLYGTTTKTDTNEEIFNTYTDKNEMVVRGMIDIEGDEIIIERKLRRSAKKGGGWTVTNKVNYYQLLPDGSEDPQNEEHAKKTTQKIKETIGSEKDFEMLVLATETTLDSLIGLTTTESGKVLTRLIGLEVLEMKENIARGMYNEFAKKKKSNDYDVITLTDEITDHEEKLATNTELLSELTTKLEKTKADIVTYRAENDKLLNSKEKIDVSISELNPSRLENDIDGLIKNGTELKVTHDALEKEISEIGKINFDEDRHYALTNQLSTNTSSLAVKNAEIDRLGRVVEELIAGGICQSCNRTLDDVDNSEHINSHNKTIEATTKEAEAIKGLLIKIGVELATLNERKAKIDAKNRLELNKDRISVQMDGLRNDIGEKRNDLKKYKLNLEAIELNKKVDIQLDRIKTEIQVLEYAQEDTITKIERVNADTKTQTSDIYNKTQIIETIKKEDEVDKIFKIYIDLVGKKGISKLVLRSVLPIINSEVQRLLEDVVDFEVEIFIDDKNNVQFLIHKDGIAKKLKSGSGLEKTAASLALRCVLGKISTLPMPNFITFDEILGKVAPDNLEKLKTLFEKIKTMYEIVFFITHNDVVKDWANTIVTVIKTNNLSKINVS